MDYSDGLKDVLIRKINKAEKDLLTLKLDYCRFVYGISHRSNVSLNECLYQIKNVDLDSMARDERGQWSRPKISGVKLGKDKRPLSNELVSLGEAWELT